MPYGSGASYYSFGGIGDNTNNLKKISGIFGGNFYVSDWFSGKTKLSSWQIDLSNIVFKSSSKLPVNAWHGCVLDKDSVTLILTTIPNITDNTKIQLGMDASLKDDSDILALLGEYDTENNCYNAHGWCIEAEWNVPI